MVTSQKVAAAGVSVQRGPRSLRSKPLILEQLREWGMKISSGQLHRLITEGKERFHREKDEILQVGLRVSRHIHVDDTGARHQGKNGYVTHIGNEWFAWCSRCAGVRSERTRLRALIQRWKSRSMGLHQRPSRVVRKVCAGLGRCVLERSISHLQVGCKEGQTTSRSRSIACGSARRATSDSGCSLVKIRAALTPLLSRLGILLSYPIRQARRCPNGRERSNHQGLKRARSPKVGPLSS
jgi:hypothetical protein